MYALIQRINCMIECALGKIIFVMFVIMVAVSFSQVVTRFFEYPLSWSEELARYMAIWLTFLGASYALRKKTLAFVEALVVQLSPAHRRLLSLGISLLIMAFCVFLCVYGSNIVLRTMRQTSPALLLPMGYVYLSAPVSGVLMFLFAAEQFMDALFRK